MDKRLPRLKKLLSKLQNGNDVQRRDLELALTTSEWTEFNSWWSDEKSNRNLTPPDELVRYIQLRKKVALANARYIRYADRLDSKSSTRQSKKLAETADNAQDKLLDDLREQLSYNSALMMWLVPIEPYTSVEETMAAGVLPQVCTSRTVASKKQAPMGKFSKRDLKVKILEQAISAIEDGSSPEPVVKMPVLKTKKKKDFSGFKV